MQELFKEVMQLSAMDVVYSSLQPDKSGYKASPMLKHYAKFSEESGELIQAINKLEGLKKWSPEDTEENIVENIAEEIADCLQCLFAQADANGISYEKIIAKFKDKNNKWRSEFDRKADILAEKNIINRIS